MRNEARPLAARSFAGLLVGVLCAAALVSPASAAATTVSSNWSGYVARSSSGRFSSVSASWVAPSVTCSAGRETHSAVWVGLGGYETRARALEQIGTEADCTAAGRAVYSSWVELLPAAAQGLRLRVRAGDRIVASVTVSGRDATLRMRDETTGRRYSTTRRLRAKDVSTAEWIVEAPSGCDSDGRCGTLGLANFGTVGFSAATATVAGATRGLGETSPEELVLLQSGGTADVAAHSRGTVVSATPSPPAGASFSVSYSESEDAAPAAPLLHG